jgi:hypothetical protein
MVPCMRMNSIMCLQFSLHALGFGYHVCILIASTMMGSNCVGVNRPANYPLLVCHASNEVIQLYQLYRVTNAYASSSLFIPLSCYFILLYLLCW